MVTLWINAEYRTQPRSSSKTWNRKFAERLVCDPRIAMHSPMEIKLMMFTALPYL